MKLTGLTYVSKAKILFDSVLLKSLATEYSKENKNYKITGYLYFDKNIFTQYIEGPMENIHQLYSNIKKDRKHEVLNELIYNSLTKRKFPNWGMKWLDKSMLGQINLEFILTDYLIFNSQTGNLTLNEKAVWRMIDKLATFRTVI